MSRISPVQDARSTEIVGRLIASKRDRLVLATSSRWRPTDRIRNSGGTSQRAAIAACEASLRGLQAARDVDLPADLLDEVDRIVPPGGVVAPYYLDDFADFQPSSHHW